MIEYKDGEPLDLLSAPMSEDADIIAISYAIKRGTAKMLLYAARTLMYADVDNQPEEILDYMAVELGAAYYDQAMDIETKRGLIKGAIKWYMTAGSAKSVQELVGTTLGGGNISEWYEFGGEPGEFGIEIECQLTEDNYKRLLETLESVKPSSAHLKTMALTKDAETDLHLGNTLAEQSISTLYENYSETTELSEAVHTGGVLASEMVQWLEMRNT